ncbi:conserved hypothetical protein [Coccidioides posadasii str. Silveira]|uniref:C6 finger domain transcription factor nscR n=1 Tax=Coccidioides posadasii (strain RMSCC 757 / Silveira) TaxID=443226 RepID=E9DBS7_COCPS|nr:conserved hypothetical protein [Coccidioides posadasii str. Silveira]
MAHIGDMATSKRTVTSCLRCRRRKIRCGRERPHCQNCIRYGYECEYLNSVAGASGYSTLDKSPANSSQSLQGHDELRNRVSQLESLVSKLVAHCGGLAAVSSTNTPPESETLPSGSRDVSEGVISDLGDLLIIDSEPRHMVGSYWRKLAAQHRDLELHLEGHDQDDGVDATCETTTPGLTPSFLFAPPDPNFQPRDCLPEFQGAERLYAIFRSRVDPITRIIHKPTFETDMRAYYFNPAKLGTSPSESQQEDWKNTRTAAAFEALLFAVFYGALNSLSEEEFLQFSQVNNYVGDLNDDVLRSIVQDERQTKHSYLRIFSFALEQSLLRSQILEKPTLNSVTACCLFLFVSCAEADVPSLYALTGVLMRVSRTLALHMDPEALVLIAGKNRRQGNHTPAIMGPIDVERRRRLWHLILHLDLMVSEAHGVDPEPLPLESWPKNVGTALPTNLDDTEIFAGNALLDQSPELAEDRGRVTEMTMQLVRFNTSLCLRRLTSLKVEDIRAESKDAQSTVAPRMEAIIEEMVQRNEKSHLRYCIKDEGFQKYTLVLGKLTEYKVRLLFYHRFLKETEPSRDDRSWNSARQQAMSSAVNLINMYQTALADPLVHQFEWHTRRHSQFHAMLHILNELSTTDIAQLDTETQTLCMQAWAAIDNVAMEPARPSKSGTVEEKLWTFLQCLRTRVRARLSIGTVFDNNAMPESLSIPDLDMTNAFNALSAYQNMDFGSSMDFLDIF